ncbi:hypothetical protein BH23ACT9_BH23ACT9_28040 [soil metagenome]
MRTDARTRPGSAEALGSALIHAQDVLGLPRSRMRIGADTPAPVRPAVAAATPSLATPRPAVGLLSPGATASLEDPGLLGGPTLERAGVPRPVQPEAEPEAPARSGRLLLAIRVAFGLAVLASIALLLLSRTGGDPLEGTSPVFRRLADPGALAEGIGDTGSVAGQARAVGSWWSLSDWCIAEGYAVAPCYDAAADTVLTLTGADPRTLAVGPQLDRATIGEGVEIGYALSQGQLAREPASVPLDE